MVGCRKPGRMLLELVVVLPILGALGVMMSSLFITHARIARLTRERARATETVRLTAGVLRSDLRWLQPEHDLQAWSGDSVRLRSFRGLAVPCARTEPERVLVHYSGLRQPDPDKDSVLVIAPAGESVFALHALRDSTGSCASWQLSAPAATLGILLVFESGAYSLTDGALRYRVGASGRQPITDEIIDSNRSRFSNSAFSLSITLKGARTSPFELRFPTLNPSRRE
jgi:hypothetical protein